MSKVTDIVQRSVVLELLRDDHHEKWTRAELHAEIDDVPPDVVGTAMLRLERAGCIVVEGCRAWASPAVRYLDGLGMVCI